MSMLLVFAFTPSCIAECLLGVDFSAIGSQRGLRKVVFLGNGLVASLSTRLALPNGGLLAIQAGHSDEKVDTGVSVVETESKMLRASRLGLRKLQAQLCRPFGAC